MDPFYSVLYNPTHVHNVAFDILFGNCNHQIIHNFFKPKLFQFTINDFLFKTHLLGVLRKQTPWCHQTPSYSPGEVDRKPSLYWTHASGLTRRCCAPWGQGNSQVASTPWSAGSLEFAYSNPAREGRRSMAARSGRLGRNTLFVPEGWCHTRSWSRVSVTLAWEPQGLSFPPSAEWGRGG